MDLVELKKQVIGKTKTLNKRKRETYMKKILTLLLTLLILVGCTANAETKTEKLYQDSHIDIEQVGSYFDKNQDQVYGFGMATIRELTEQEVELLVNSGTSFRNNDIQNQWIVFEMDSVNEINPETKEYLGKIKPVVLQGYKEIYKPKHIEVSDDKYKVLLPKDLLEEKGLQFFFNEYLIIGLN